MMIKLLQGIKNLARCIQRYPLHTVLFLVAVVAFYCWVCTYFAVLLAVYAMVWAAKQKAS